MDYGQGNLNRENMSPEEGGYSPLGYSGIERDPRKIGGAVIDGANGELPQPSFKASPLGEIVPYMPPGHKDQNDSSDGARTPDVANGAYTGKVFDGKGQITPSVMSEINNSIAAIDAPDGPYNLAKKIADLREQGRGQ